MTTDDQNALSPEAREAMEAAGGRWLRAMGSGLRVDDQQPVQPAKTRQRGAEGTQSASSDPLSLRSLRVGDEVVIVDDILGAYDDVVDGACGNRLSTARYMYHFNIDTGWARGAPSERARVYTPAAHKLRTAVDTELCLLLRRLPHADTARLLAIHDALKAAGLL